LVRRPSDLLYTASELVHSDHPGKAGHRDPQVSSLRCCRPFGRVITGRRSPAAHRRADQYGESGEARPYPLDYAHSRTWRTLSWSGPRTRHSFGLHLRPPRVGASHHPNLQRSGTNIRTRARTGHAGNHFRSGYLPKGSMNLADPSRYSSRSRLKTYRPLDSSRTRVTTARCAEVSVEKLLMAVERMERGWKGARQSPAPAVRPTEGGVVPAVTHGGSEATAENALSTDCSVQCLT
jgi:hypothetical protein